MSSRPVTLQRALVLGTGLLVAVALVIMSAATIIALNAFVSERLDDQVREGLHVAAHPDTDDTDGSRSAGGDRGEPAPRVGTLQVVTTAGGETSSSYVSSNGSEVSLSDDQIAALTTAVPTDGVPVSVDLGGELGLFRVAAEEVSGRTVIAGISASDATATTSALLIILVAVGGITLVAAVVGLTFLVRRALRPLERVAAVAQRVSASPLGHGDVEIPDRVAPSDTDPRTEVGRVGASLNELLGHVQSALQARAHSEAELRRFIADASHELRTPLASVRGYAQLSLTEAAPMTPGQRRSLERIEAEARRMATLVDDLLLLARLDAGQQLRDDDVELPLLVVDAVSDARTVDRTHEWRIELADDPIGVRGDEDRLRQVVSNLLRNAQNHTPAGTVVTTSLTRDGTDAVLRVHDDGPGIDPLLADRLFERFARGDRARNRDAGSTGLGLSIAHAITLAHGGDIRVDSELGSTTFEVRLPLHRAGGTEA